VATKKAAKKAAKKPAKATKKTAKKAAKAKSSRASSHKETKKKPVKKPSKRVTDRSGKAHRKPAKKAAKKPTRKKRISPEAMMAQTKAAYDKLVRDGRIHKLDRRVTRRKLRGRFSGENVTVRIGLSLSDSEILEIMDRAEEGLDQLDGEEVYATIELYERGRNAVGSGFGKHVGRGEASLTQSYIGVHSVPREAMLQQVQMLLESHVPESRNGSVVHSIRFYRRNETEE
jgi:hypothetical protein